MTYWNEVMQDDCYSITVDGWKAEVYRVMVENSKKKLVDKGWDCDLVPKELVINRYFLSDKQYIEQLESEKDAVSAQIEELEQVQITHTLPDLIIEEITEPVEWQLGFFIPFSLMEKYVGSIENLMDQEWKGNFYKCSSGTSHPHWASWSPVDEKNFHLPHCFGILKLEFECRRKNRNAW